MVCDGRFYVAIVPSCASRFFGSPRVSHEGQESGIVLTPALIPADGVPLRSMGNHAASVVCIPASPWFFSMGGRQAGKVSDSSAA